jgi:hypothetical protein
MPMLLLAALFAAAAPGAPSGACLPITQEQDGPVTLSGRLERHVYPGPPNYESIRGGDRAEPAYILVLDRPICLNEETVIPARAPILRVHLYASRDAMWPRLRGAVGHTISVSGRGFGAITAHHHAPLVVDVANLQIRR